MSITDRAQGYQEGRVSNEQQVDDLRARLAAAEARAQRYREALEKVDESDGHGRWCRSEQDGPVLLSCDCHLRIVRAALQDTEGEAAPACREQLAAAHNSLKIFTAEVGRISADADGECGDPTKLLVLHMQMKAALASRPAREQGGEKPDWPAEDILRHD